MKAIIDRNALATALKDAAGVAANDTRKLADRIEAEAKREREMSKGLSKKLDKNHAIPGNAAAMREALENLLDEAEHGYDIRDAPVAGAPGERQTYHVVAAEYIIDTARASLSAPARNCDRFECAEEAWIHYCDEQGQASDRSWKALILFGKWLFAKAKEVRNELA